MAANPAIVTWSGTSEAPGDVLPLGNGRVGGSLRVRAGGSLEIDLTSAEGLDAHGRLLKLARFELALDATPSTPVDDASVSQQLILSDAEASVEHPAFSLRARIDRRHPCLVLTMTTRASVSTRLTARPWRTEPRTVGREEVFAFWGRLGGPEPVVVPPDRLRHATRTDPDGERRALLGWWHVVGASQLRSSLALQGFGDLAHEVADPVGQRAFGTLVWAHASRREPHQPWSLRTPRRREHSWYVAIHACQARTPEAWWDAACAARQALDVSGPAARERHLAAARRTWGCGALQPYGTPGAERVSAALAAQRYLTLAAGDGPWPVRFNGSLFTVDVPETLIDPPPHQDPDYRRWNGAFWWQNTRLVYWPLLASGDEAVLEPLYALMDRAWPLARIRAQRWYGAAGAVLPETMTPWGLHADGDYGWDRAGRRIGEVANPFVRGYHHAVLELAWLWLRHHRASRDDDALVRRAPQLLDALRFFATTARPDRAGRLRWRGTQALETYHDVDDSAADIAALYAITGALSRLPRRLLGAALDDLARDVARRLPPLPTRRRRDGTTVWRAARTIRAAARNFENPELYAVFPYALTGRGRRCVQLARATFAARRFRRTGGWYPDALHAAALGLTAAARRDVERNAAAVCGRFPAMFGPNFDWVPDQDHGNVTTLAVQRLALELVRDGERGRAPPRWPQGWGVTGTIVDEDGRRHDLDHAPVPADVR